jgi:hypothetical protein
MRPERRALHADYDQGEELPREKAESAGPQD